MNLEGRVIAVNRQLMLAAADIGYGQALVFEFQAGALIELGDKLENLTCGYQRVYCENTSQCLELNILILTGQLSIDLAKFVVGGNTVFGQQGKLAQIVA